MTIQTQRNSVLIHASWILLGFVFLLGFMAITDVTALEPFGAEVTSGTPETAPADTAGNDSAQAGNITELTISGFSTTQTWQGYFGNVTGTIQLADASDNVLYNWTLASPEGEVYATVNNSVSWINIQCFNYTANGSHISSGETAGGINLFGTNLTQLESQYNIQADDVDGVNETFTLEHGGAGEHDEFFTANLQFAEGECISTRVYSSNGLGENDLFEEVLLYEPTTTSVVFASLLEEADTNGFDGNPHDFEMLVLEDGHGTDKDATTYFFYVEIE